MNIKHCISAMQAAVDIVHGSPHPANKIAAALTGREENGNAFELAYTNYWPDEIQDTIGRKTKVGNSSGTMHAETACLLHAPITKDASIFITDPPCPNCAKNMAEAGIADVCIDHKGFDKDFAVRRGTEYESLSLRIFEHAGIAVSVIERKNKKIIPVIENPPAHRHDRNPPAEISEIEEDLNFRTLVKRTATKQSQPFAIATGEKAGRHYALITQAALAPGFESEDLSQTNNGKYTLIIEPLNRLLMQAVRRGMKLNARQIYSSRVPTAREQVNMIGAGHRQFYVGDMRDSRDEYGLHAMAQLQGAGIVEYKQLSP